MKRVLVWVNPDNQLLISKESGTKEFPYTLDRARRITNAACSLHNKGWKFRPFFGSAVGWVAEEPEG